MINYSTKSWHYRLANHYGPLENNEAITDLCRYTRQVIAGMIVAFIVAPLVGVFIGNLAIAPIMWLVVNLLYGWTLKAGTDPSIVIGLVLYGVAGVIGILIGIAKLHQYYAAKHKTQYKPSVFTRARDAIDNSFIGHVYHSFKDKFCYRIILTETVDPLNCIPHQIYIGLSNGRVFEAEQPILGSIDSYTVAMARFIYDATAQKWIKQLDNGPYTEDPSSLAETSEVIQWWEVEYLYQSQYSGPVGKHSENEDQDGL